jgi:hypothetical protein
LFDLLGWGQKIRNRQLGVPDSFNLTKAWLEAGQEHRRTIHDSLANRAINVMEANENRNGEVSAALGLIWVVADACGAGSVAEGFASVDAETGKQLNASQANKRILYGITQGVALYGGARIVLARFAPPTVSGSSSIPQELTGPAPKETLFKNGELFEAVFESSQGKVGLLAETVVHGKTLHLKDIVIEPITTGKLNIGTKEVLAARQQLIEQARACGFEKLIITGKRLTGANVGKQVELIIDLFTK